MVKSKEVKLKRDDDPVIVGQVKLSNGFEDQKSFTLSNGDSKEETSNGEKTGILQDIATSTTANETSTKEVNDSGVQGIRQDATSYGDGGKGKEKAVEPVVQDKLQNLVSSGATKKRNIPIWFRLVASNEKNKNAPLRQISFSYIRVKNSNMQLSYLKRYVAKKLDLKSEDEVELYLDNEPLDSSIMLFDLWQYWISTKEDVDIRNLEVGSSGADYVMVVNYGRNLDM